MDAEEAKRDKSLDGKLAWYRHCRLCAVGAFAVVLTALCIFVWMFSYRVTGVLSALQQLAGVEVAVLGPQQLQVVLNVPGPKGARRARFVLKLGAFVAPGTPTVQTCQVR